MPPPNQSSPSTTPPRRGRSSRWWIGLSFLVSSLILLWAFTLPFRNPGPSVGSVNQVSGIQTAFSLSAGQRRAEAEQFREDAIAEHHDYLRSLEKKRQLHDRRELPRKQEVVQRWNQRVELMQARIKKLDSEIQRSDAPEGSLMWQNREELTKVLDDKPI